MRWLLIVVLLAFITGGLVYAYYPVSYTGVVKYYVAASPPSVLEPKVWDQLSHESYAKLQASTITSKLVLNVVLSEPGIAALPMFADDTEKDPIEQLQKQIRVSFPEGWEYMMVQLDGTDKEQILLVLKALQVAFQKEVVQREYLRRTHRFNSLQRLLDQTSDEIKTINANKKNVGLNDDLESKLTLNEMNRERLIKEMAPMKLEMDAPVRIQLWDGAHVNPASETPRRRSAVMIAVGSALVYSLLFFLFLRYLRNLGTQKPAPPATNAVTHN